LGVGAPTITGGSHYEILGVEDTASFAEIRASYLALLRQWHPDVAPAERRTEADEVAKRLNIAYSVLSDPALRARYDFELRFDPEEALRLARERIERETEEYLRRQSAWQQIVDEFRVSDARERARSTGPAWGPGFQMPRVGLTVTIVAPADRRDDLESWWNEEAREASVTLRSAGRVRARRRRTRERIYVEGARGDVKAFLGALGRRLEAEAATAGGRRNAGLHYNDFVRL
jgi:curved DNA-binding protein CbpA